MNKPVLLTVIFIFFLLISCTEKQTKPNIILICADDLGWSDIGCYLQFLLLNSQHLAPPKGSMFFPGRGHRNALLMCKVKLTQGHCHEQGNGRRSGLWRDYYRRTGDADP